MSRIKEKALIKEFGEAQLAKLDVRSEKYERLGWRQKDISDLLYWLGAERNELESAIAGGNVEEMKDEAIDVSLLAMMIYDKVSGNSKIK